MEKKEVVSLSIEERYRSVCEKILDAEIRYGRPAGSTQLIAVSKNHSIDKIKLLYQLGHRDFGENYVQELLQKSEQAKEAGLNEIRWHFIGHLQTNKVKALLPRIAYIHTIDSLRLAEEIEKRADRKIPVLIEVNLDAQESKSGVLISDLRNLVEIIRTKPHLDLQGLMCIPDPNRRDGVQNAFKKLRELAHSLNLPHLSMGMSQDFESAIAEGAKWVRLGTLLFGERSPREKL